MVVFDTIHTLAMGRQSASKLEAKNPPVAKAARTRLYDIIKKGTMHKLKNKEGHVFDVNADDVVFIGEFTKTEQVTPTELTLLISRTRGFLFIRFIKADGSMRDMYAHVNGPMVGSKVYLRDLEQPAQTMRCCDVNRVVCVVAQDTMYVVKSASLGKLLKKKK